MEIEIVRPGAFGHSATRLQFKGTVDEWNSMEQNVDRILTKVQGNKQ